MHDKKSKQEQHLSIMPSLFSQGANSITEKVEVMYVSKEHVLKQLIKYKEC